VDRYLIKSVLGFNLKVEIKDQEGNLIKTGIKRTSFPVIYSDRINSGVFDKSFFTSFNEDLLAKIRQHRRLND
jgi:hypothetical protein